MNFCGSGGSLTAVVLPADDAKPKQVIFLERAKWSEGIERRREEQRSEREREERRGKREERRSKREKEIYKMTHYDVISNKRVT